MTDSVFTPTPDTGIVDPVSELVGEGKKFKTVADLAKGKLESDNFIVKLQGELADIRADLNKQTDANQKVEELRQEVVKLRTERVSSGSSKPNEQVQTTPGLSKEDLQTLVAQTISENEKNRTASQNILVANSEAIKLFGTSEKATEVIRQKAKDLGLSVDDLREIAARSPTAFAKMVFTGETAANPAAGSITSGIAKSQAVAPGGVTYKEGTKEFFDNIRQTDPKKYWTPEVQNRIYAAARDGTYVTP